LLSRGSGTPGGVPRDVDRLFFLPYIPFNAVAITSERKHDAETIESECLSNLLFGMFMGLVLALAEAIGEGGLAPHQVNRFIAVASAFVGLEASGVVVGYAFLAKPLGLFRHDSNDTRRNEHSIQEG
jgi:hypothetical protein